MKKHIQSKKVRKGLTAKVSHMLCTGILLLCGVWGSAQPLQTVAVYPATSVNSFYRGGGTFEISSPYYMQVHRLEVFCGDQGLQSVEIYYRPGGVEHSTGLAPIIDSAHGWELLGTFDVNVTQQDIPSVSEIVDLYLKPGVYGFYVQMPNASLGMRGNLIDTAETGGVSMRTTGWRGDVPNLNPTNYNTAFYGGLRFRVLSHLSGDIATLKVNSDGIYCPGSNAMEATIANFGASQINTATLNWSVNGVTQSSTAFNGLLDTIGGQGSLVQDIVLGNYTFVSGQQYAVQVWSSLPNGNVDPFNANDTASTIFYTALDGGAYTIDPSGSGPNNFTNFTAVSKALSNGGICGPVSFTIAQGTYTDHLYLGHVEGASATNTIIFDGGDSSLVELSYSSSDDTATILVQGTDYATFKNMTISNSSSGDAWGVMLQENADHVTIDRCKFVLPRSSSTDLIAVIATDNMGGESNGQNANYTTISNCTFIGGECGINLEGPGDRPYAFGHKIINNVFRFQDDHALDLDQISGIEILNNDADSLVRSSADAFIFDEIDDFVISGNSIISPDIAFDLNDANQDFEPATRSVISNNTILSETDNAFDIDDFAYVDIFYNTTQGSPAMEINDPVVVDIRNNIFSSPGVAFGTDGLLANTDTVDYNLYDGSFELDGINLNTLSEWLALEPKHNLNSLQGLPMFLGPRDLHINGPMANGNADPAVGIAVDIDGDARSTANPDMGADEINTFVDTCLQAGGFRLIARTASSVTFAMDRAGVTYSLEWGPCGFIQGAGTVVSGVAPLTISGLSPNVCYEFYARRVCSSSSNYNDTIGPFPVRTECTGPLPGGTYTVDPGQPLSTSNFHSITEVAKTLENCGISGAVTFNVVSGMYSGALYFPKVNGTSASNTITFNGADSSNTRIYYDGVSNPGQETTLKIDGCDWLTFNNFKIENGSTSSTAQVILVGNSSDNLTISTCAIVHAIGASGESVLLSDYVPAPYSASSDFGDNISLEYNTFQNGSRGMYTYGSDNTNGSNGLFLDNNLRIVGNVFSGFQTAIELWNIGNFIIEENHVSNVSNEAIRLLRVRGFEITRNTISYDNVGIYLNSLALDGVSASNLVVNNVIYTDTVSTGRGLELWVCSDVGVHHNTVTRFFCFESQDIDVKNNIFVGDDRPGVEFANTVVRVNLDYNNYYASGTGSLFVDNQGTVFNSLSDWQAAYPAYDQHSVSGDPQFAGPTDFHPSGRLLNNTGDSLGILTDFDGNTRSLHFPDMGAYEFSLPCLSVTLSGSAANIAPTSAEISWTRQFNQGTSTGTTNNIEYGVSGFSLGSGTTLKDVDSPQLLTGLSQGTTYEFYVQDSCGTEGTSSWAGPYSFTTTVVPCAPSTALGADQNSPVGARLFWTAGGAAQWNVEYGPTGFTPGTGTLLYNNQNDTLTLNTLAGSTCYDFYVQDSCGLNYVSAWVGPFNFCTQACTAPTNLSADQITPTGARLLWTTGGASNWNVEYGPTGFTPGNGTYVYNAPSTMLSISSLVGGTCYDFYVQDSCGTNSTSSWSGPYNFCTLSCAAPTNLGADQVRTTGARVYWTAGGASDWNVEYGPTGFTLGTGSYLYGAQNDTLTINALLAGSCYDVYVQDSCGAGNTSGWSGPYNFCTPSCTAPTNLGADQLTSGGARLYWTPGNANRWRVQYGATGFSLGTGTLLSSSNDTLSLSTLALSTCYDFYVQDSCGVGSSSGWTGPYNFCTAGCVLSAGNDSTIDVCITDPAFDLTPYLGTHDVGGSWVDLDASGYLSGNLVVFGFGATAKTFRVAYVLSAPNCPNDTAVITINAEDLPNAGMDMSFDICDTLSLDLDTMLSGQDAGGIWVDVDNSGGLTGSVVDFSLVAHSNTYVYQYVALSPGCGNDTANVVVTVDSCKGVGIGEYGIRGLAVYPNPSAGVFSIEFKVNAAMATLKLTDLSGQLVYSNTLENLNGQYKGSIDISGLAAGTYLLTIESDGVQEVVRVMKE